MTDKVTELAKKHGAIDDNGYIVFQQKDHFEKVVRAIIKEASAPLVEALHALEAAAIDSNEHFYRSVDNRYIIKNCEKALAEFNKEFGDD